MNYREKYQMWLEKGILCMRNWSLLPGMKP